MSQRSPYSCRWEWQQCLVFLCFAFAFDSRRSSGCAAALGYGRSCHYRWNRRHRFKELHLAKFRLSMRDIPCRHEDWKGLQN
ncbi:hypothetical protein V6N13_085633 [Hibiscus sabdariffa]|uniref:Secreted protein n=1 Tax=Hibiscus sabdariffa TaxID=183260 RepID=A0ABR2D238_9ROSI